MKKMLCFVLPFFVWACKSDMPSNNDTTYQQATKNAQVSPPSQSVVNQGNTTNPFIEDIVLAAEQKTVAAGESFCMQLSVSNFLGILSTQYTLSWDTEVLTFEKLQNFKLPYMNEQDFGLPLTKQGKLTCVWIDDSLRGVSLPDGSPMYEICFQANATASGKSTPVAFTEQPTPFESVNLKEQVLGINTVNGMVEVE